jgi:hypothetical protein
LGAAAGFGAARDCSHAQKKSTAHASLAYPSGEPCQKNIFTGRIFALRDARSEESRYCEDSKDTSAGGMGVSQVQCSSGLKKAKQWPPGAEPPGVPFGTVDPAPRSPFELVELPNKCSVRDMKRVEAKIEENRKEDSASEPDKDPNTWLIEAKVDQDILDWEKGETRLSIRRDRSRDR